MCKVRPFSLPFLLQLMKCIPNSLLPVLLHIQIKLIYLIFMESRRGMITILSNSVFTLVFTLEALPVVVMTLL